MGQVRRAIGSTRKLASGRYQVRYTDPFGTRRTGGTFATKVLAEQELGRVVRAIEGGTWTPNGGVIEGVSSNKVTLRDISDKWRGTRVSKRGMPLSPTTLDEYARLVDSTMREFADRPLRGITAAQVETWWTGEHRRAPNQASKAYKHLNQLCEYAIRQGVIQLNPCQIDGASNYQPAALPDVPSYAQVQIMLNEAEFPWTAFYALAAWGGFRKGELLELRRKDIEIASYDGEQLWTVAVRRTVIYQGTKVTVKEPKTVGSIRDVVLPPLVTETLQAHLKGMPLGAEQLVFPHLKDPSRHQGEFEMRHTWRHLQEVSGFKGRFHSLRAFASTQYGLLGATTVELMDRLGHRDVKTAMRYQRTTGRDVALLKTLKG